MSEIIAPLVPIEPPSNLGRDAPVHSQTPPITQNLALLEFWTVIKSEMDEPLTWESLFENVAVLLEIDLELLDTVKLRKRLDPSNSLKIPTLAKLVLAIKKSLPEEYFIKFVIPLVEKPQLLVSSDEGITELMARIERHRPASILGWKTHYLATANKEFEQRHDAARQALEVRLANLQNVEGKDEKANLEAPKLYPVKTVEEISSANVISNNPRFANGGSTSSLDKIKATTFRKASVHKESSSPLKPKVLQIPIKSDEIALPTNSTDPSNFIPPISTLPTSSLSFREECAKANNNDPQSQYFLGCCYYQGHNVPQDHTIAVYWFKLSAQNKYSQAEYILGVYYEFGFEKLTEHCNLKDALVWYDKAACNGNIQAMCHLGFIYMNDAKFRNLKKSFAWYEKAANLNDPGALNALASFYEKGVEVRKDSKAAAELFEKSAKLGSDLGMYNYAACLMKGIGVEKNEKMGIDWYIDAANLGNVEAQNSLGICYLNGTGVEPNENLAFKIFESACLQEYTLAYHNLAYCYEHGLGTIMDWSQAIKYYKLAAKKGNLESQYHLGVMLEKSDPEQAKYWC